MRLLLLLPLLILVGCNELPDAIGKQPTYLKCDSYSDQTIWIVLDHQEKVWISSSNKNGDSSTENFFLSVYDLLTYDDSYGFRFYDKLYKLDRKSLKYNSYTDFQCVVTGELSKLRSVGLEKNRIKI